MKYAVIAQDNVTFERTLCALDLNFTQACDLIRYTRTVVFFAVNERFVNRFLYPTLNREPDARD